MSKLYRESTKASKNAIEENGKWLFGVPAIVADNDDPERQHRVRLIIPSIDEDAIYDEWARQMVFCLGDGYGTAFIPPKGSEVVVFGQLGMKYNLYYASLFNEEMEVPEGFDDEKTVGVHAPGDLKLIAEDDEEFKARNIEINAEILNQLKGLQIKLNGTTISINGNGNVSIVGATVAISSTGVLTLEGRPVSKVGPAI